MSRINDECHVNASGGEPSGIVAKSAASAWRRRGFELISLGFHWMLPDRNGFLLGFTERELFLFLILM